MTFGTDRFVHMLNHLAVSMTTFINCSIIGCACEPQNIANIAYFIPFNQLGHNDAMWQHRAGSTLAHARARCLMTPDHYLNQFWLPISEALCSAFTGEQFYCKCTSCYYEFDTYTFGIFATSPWTITVRHNGHNGVSNHQPHGCLLNRLFRRGSKKTSKLRVIGLCAGNSPVAGEFPAQRASNEENISISWRHHASEWTIFIPLIHSQLILGTWIVNRHKLTFFSEWKITSFCRHDIISWLISLIALMGDRLDDYRCYNKCLFIWVVISGNIIDTLQVVELRQNTTKCLTFPCCWSHQTIWEENVDTVLEILRKNMETSL